MKKILIVSTVLSALLTLGTTGQSADFDGDGRDDVAVFRPSNGQWVIRGFTRMYFGTSADTPFAGDFDGDGIADPAYHRESNGFWKAKGVTQFYFGNAGLGDEQVSAGTGGQRLYDYVVKRGDVDDLVAALSGDDYSNVFIPAGDYWVTSDIIVDSLQSISGTGGEGFGIFPGITAGTRIHLDEDCNIILATQAGVTLKNIVVMGGGGGSGQIQVSSACDYSRLINITASNSDSHAFYASSGADNILISGCVASGADNNGFYQFDGDCSLANCQAIACDGVGFQGCDNLSGCIANGGGYSSSGFYGCEGLTACRAYDCTNHGFNGCNRLSSCRSASNTKDGFYNCDRISACESSYNTENGYRNCNYVSASYSSFNGTNWNNCLYTAACNDGS